MCGAQDPEGNKRHLFHDKTVSALPRKSAVSAFRVFCPQLQMLREALILRKSYSAFYFLRVAGMSGRPWGVGNNQLMGSKFCQQIVYFCEVIRTFSHFPETGRDSRKGQDTDSARHQSTNGRHCTACS